MAKKSTPAPASTPLAANPSDISLVAVSQPLWYFSTKLPEHARPRPCFVTGPGDEEGHVNVMVMMDATLDMARGSKVQCANRRNVALYAEHPGHLREGEIVLYPATAMMQLQRDPAMAEWIKHVAGEIQRPTEAATPPSNAKSPPPPPPPPAPPAPPPPPPEAGFLETLQKHPRWVTFLRDGRGLEACTVKGEANRAVWSNPQGKEIIAFRHSKSGGYRLVAMTPKGEGKDIRGNAKTSGQVGALIQLASEILRSTLGAKTKADVERGIQQALDEFEPRE